MLTDIKKAAPCLSRSKKCFLGSPFGGLRGVVFPELGQNIYAKYQLI